MSVRVLIAIFLLGLLPMSLVAQDSKWFELSSSHFVVFTDASEAKGRRLVTDLEGRAAAFAGVFGSIPDREFPIEVFLFSKSEDFVEAVPTGLVKIDKSAYLQKGPDRTFVVARDKSPEEVAGDVGHALGHVFFERYVLWKPFWLSEAAGEYFRKVGREPDTKLIAPADGFNVSDLLTIAPSATYQDSEPGGVFRTQSYRLLRILSADYPGPLRDWIQVLRTEGGNKIQPRIDVASVDARLPSYVETAPKGDAASNAIQSAPVDAARMAVHRGDLMLAMGKTAEAGRWYNADNADARAARAILTRFSRANLEAVRGLDRTARELPNNGLVQFHFGSLDVQAAKDVELQVQALESAVKLLPKMGRAYAELARVYVLSEKFDKALPAADRAIELEPEYADRFYEIRADALAGLKRLDEAYQSVQLASALPHKDRAEGELYERKIAAMARRIENIRREGEAVRADQLRNEVVQRAAQVDPPKPAPVVATRRDGRIAYEIEARAPVEVVDQPFPLYPDNLIQSAKAGNIALNVTIGANGQVTNATVASSQIPELNAATIEAARHWTFKPVILSGRASPITIRIIFQYIVQ